jgi:NADPH-dependent glutamate synthase beta subunit-like oxidoreductase
LAVLSSVAIGSWPPYSERLPATLRAGTFTRRFCPAPAIERTVRAASISEASEMSSE